MTMTRGQRRPPTTTLGDIASAPAGSRGIVRPRLSRARCTSSSSRPRPTLLFQRAGPRRDPSAAAAPRHQPAGDVAPTDDHLGYAMPAPRGWVVSDID